MIGHVSLVFFCYFVFIEVLVENFNVVDDGWMGGACERRVGWLSQERTARGEKKRKLLAWVMFLNTRQGSWFGY